MGYTTKFKGSLKLSKPLNKDQQEWYDNWIQLRKVVRDRDLLKDHYGDMGSLDGEYGEYGEFFNYLPRDVEGEDRMWYLNGHGDIEQGIVDNNKGLPIYDLKGSLWCQWMIKGDDLCWNGKEKFYSYEGWLKFIKTEILGRWDIEILDGHILWSGEDMDDHGMLIVEDNEIHSECYHYEYPRYNKDHYDLEEVEND